MSVNYQDLNDLFVSRIDVLEFEAEHAERTADRVLASVILKELEDLRTEVAAAYYNDNDSSDSES